MLENAYLKEIWHFVIENPCSGLIITAYEHNILITFSTFTVTAKFIKITPQAVRKN